MFLVSHSQITPWTAQLLVATNDPLQASTHNMIRINLEDRVRKFLQGMFVKERNRLFFQRSLCIHVCNINYSRFSMLSTVAICHFKGVMAPVSGRDLPRYDKFVVVSIAHIWYKTLSSAITTQNVIFWLVFSRSTFPIYVVSISLWWKRNGLLQNCQRLVNLCFESHWEVCFLQHPHVPLGKLLAVCPMVPTSRICFMRMTHETQVSLQPSVNPAAARAV